jgi:hypothetical protein
VALRNWTGKKVAELITWRFLYQSSPSLVPKRPDPSPHRDPAALGILLILKAFYDFVSNFFWA